MMLTPPTTASMIEANTTQPVHAPPTPADDRGAGTRVLAISVPLAEDLALLGGELLLGEDAVVAQLGEVPELLDRVALGLGGRVRGGCRLRLGVLLLRFVAGPPPRLTAGDAVADGRRGSGDGRGAGDPANQSGHGVSFGLRSWTR